MKSLQTLLKEALRERVEKEGVGSISRKDAIVLAVVEKAMRGDLPSVNFIRELTESKTRSAKNTEQVVRVRVVNE